MGNYVKELAQARNSCVSKAGTETLDEQNVRKLIHSPVVSFGIIGPDNLCRGKEHILST